MDAWRIQQSYSTSRHAILTSHFYADREFAPELLEQSPRRSPGHGLRSAQRSWRLTDELQILSWNPGSAPGFNPVAPPSLMLTVRSLASAQSTVRCDSVSTTPLLAIARTTVVGWMLWRVQHSGPASRHRTLASHLMLIGSHHLNSWSIPLVVLLDPLSVRISEIGVRQTSFRSSPGVLALQEDLTRARWLRTTIARGM